METLYSDLQDGPIFNQFTIYCVIWRFDVYHLNVVQMFLERAMSEPSALIGQHSRICSVERGCHGHLNDHLVKDLPLGRKRSCGELLKNDGI